MKEIKVTYDGNRKTTTVYGNSPLVLKTDASAQSHEEKKALTPVDMFISSLGACMLTIMGIAAARRGINTEGATATMTYTQDENNHKVDAINITFHLPSIELSETDKKVLGAAIKACPVGISIDPGIKKEITFVYE